jgi:hypothetical protein
LFLHDNHPVHNSNRERLDNPEHRATRRFCFTTSKVLELLIVDFFLIY